MKARIFDVCVLGEGTGGLIAALLLQKRHAKIAVLRKRNEGDFSPAMCEFLNGFSLKPALKRVGFHPAEVNAIPSLDSPVQIVFPENRIDCFGDEQRFERELTREYPQRQKQILKLFRESHGHIEVFQHLLNSRVPLPPKGFFAKRQFQKVLQQVCDVKLLEHRPLRKELAAFDVGENFIRALDAMRLCLTQLQTDWTCGASLAHLLTLVRWEGYWTPEGLVTIQKMLVDRVKERGGVIVDFDEIRELQFSGRHVAGFALHGAAFDEVGCTALIVAGDPRGLIAAAPDHKRMAQWTRKLEELPTSLQKAYQVYRLAPEGLPIGMKPQGVIVPAGPPEGSAERRSFVRAIRYVVRQKQTEGKGPEIWMGLCAFLPASGTLPEAAVLEKEIRESLKNVLPFLDGHLLGDPSKLFIPSHRRKPGDVWQGYIYSSESPRDLGVMGFTPETPWANTFVAGDMIFPGLGLDGEIIAGMQVSQYAGGCLRRDKDLGD